MEQLTNTCPGCEGKNFIGEYSISNQPIILNYRFQSAEEASNVLRRDILLRECADCGLIFNANFKIEDVPYDENYENRQHFSKVFMQHLEKVAGLLANSYSLEEKQILEVGCGKGDFLKILCTKANAGGLGYDTTYEDTETPCPEGLHFHPTYVYAKDIKQQFDLIVCRHVVEHVFPISTFLQELHAIAVACGDPIVVIETPRFEWIAEQVSFWDVFNEHCNYFSMDCLANLCRRVGFEVVNHRAVFGDQYQLIELKNSSIQQNNTNTPLLQIPGECLNDFSRKSEECLNQLKEKLKANGAKNGWAVWGAGAKGVTLVNRFSEMKPSYVVDNNVAKQGCNIPGSDVLVIAGNDPRILEVELILIANPNYEEEIKADLKKLGYSKNAFSL